MHSVRVFRYVEALDAFLVTDEYRALADFLGLTEWHPAVWIGRLFMLDNDFGEHWFDNWDERETREDNAKAMGMDSSDLMVVSPERMADGRDGPCHSPEIRKRFWTDVLRSLEISHELLFEVARQENENGREVLPEDYIEDLEERIAQIRLDAGRQSLQADPAPEKELSPRQSRGEG
jgi:hypothetical protein